MEVTSALWVLGHRPLLRPHSAYMAPMTRENFDINIGNTFEGIGASLVRQGEYRRSRT